MRTSHVCVWVCLVAGAPAIASPQGLAAVRNPATPDVFSGPIVTDAPFSADATTTVTQVLGDGTRIEQTTTARFYRDRAGRVRREQTIVGLGALNGGGTMETITIAPEPATGNAYTLDPMTRTARLVPRVGLTIAAANNVFFLNGAPTAVVQGGRRGGGPAAGGGLPEESLGTRQFDGVKAIGRKTTRVIPAGQIGNDRPIEITDERWESPELRMLVYSRNSDPRTGVVEYRLTNINRSEPPADLFVIPSDYTVAAPPSFGAGARGRGGRGGPQ
jgi:hypothetical protein